MLHNFILADQHYFEDMAGFVIEQQITWKGKTGDRGTGTR